MGFVKFRITCLTFIIALLFSFSLAFPQSEETEHPADVKEAETVQPEQEEAPQTAVEAGGPEKGTTEIVPPQPKAEPHCPGTGKKTRVPARIQPQQKSPATVSFFFDDADIFEVVQTFSATSSRRITSSTPGEREGELQDRHSHTERRSAVGHRDYLRLNGIGYVEEGGLYRIIPLSDVSKELVYSQIGKTPENVAIEMFTFKNMDLKESMTDIETALGSI